MMEFKKLPSRFSDVMDPFLDSFKFCLKMLYKAFIFIMALSVAGGVLSNLWMCTGTNSGAGQVCEQLETKCEGTAIVICNSKHEWSLVMDCSQIRPMDQSESGKWTCCCPKDGEPECLPIGLCDAKHK